VANGGIVWNPPIWSDHGEKHFPDPNTPWRKIVVSTGGKRGVAKYHPNLTRTMIAEFEMEAIAGQGHEILPHPKPNVRMFWREFTDLGFAVGASEGQETSYIYVEYNSSGPVHGRPMTGRLLTAKGATL
jgi:hypothetical protein